MKSKIVVIDIEGLEQLVRTAVREEITQLERTAPSDAQETYLTAKEIAQLYRVSTVTVYAWIREKVIPFIKINKRLRFPKSKILEHLKTYQRNGKKSS